MMKKRIVVAVGSAIVFVLIGVSAYAYFGGKESRENKNIVAKDDSAISIPEVVAENVVSNVEDSLEENSVAQEIDQKQEATTSEEKTTAAVAVESMPKSTSDLRIVLNGKGSYECVPSGANPDEAMSLSKVYVKGNILREDTLFGPYHAYAVIKDGHSYSWVPGLLGVQTLEAKADWQANTGEKYNFDHDSELSLQCEWLDIADSFFDIPSDDSLNLPAKVASEVSEGIADRLLASTRTPVQDSKRGYSFNFPTDAGVSPLSWPNLDNYQLSGAVEVDYYSQFSFSTNAMHKKLVTALEPDSFMVTPTTVDTEYAYWKSMDADKTYADVEPIKDTSVNLGVLGNAKLYSALNKTTSQYQTMYFFENDDYVFTVYVSGPSEKVDGLAEKLVKSFK